MWYFGFDFIDTIILITRKTFAIIGGNKKSMNIKNLSIEFIDLSFLNLSQNA